MGFMSCAGMKAAFVVCYDHCQATDFSGHDASLDCDRTAPFITETPPFRRNGAHGSRASRWASHRTWDALP